MGKGAGAHLPTLLLWALLVGKALLCPPYGAAAVAAEPASRDDFLAVLSAAPYPLQLMAYCHGAVAKDDAVLAAGRGWNERNGEMLANIENLAAPAGISADVRREAEEGALAGIVALVGTQADKPAYCAAIARLIDAGYYDIDRRADLKDALKRIFGKG
jgi:hypothetical protein